MFIKGRVVDFVVMVVLFVATWISIYLAHRGKTREIRSIPSLTAVTEGVKRAAEMGRPVFMSAGFGGVGSATTMAGFAMLDVVASECARLEVPLRTTFASSETLGAAEMIVAEAFRREGRPDLYQPGKQVIYFSGEQYAWVAGIGGLMARERPACAVYMGTFFSEALYFGECGARVGALQIGGTTAQLALPLLAMTMDYLMIGEEIYAVAATITKDPVQMGSVTAQDIGKIILYAISVIGVILMLAGSDIVVKLMNT
ncbi:hypothetical protein DRO56_01320 [Candidatus Bathyarchaeota archaeon]|nr:MAG: hypothetical protein DRO56_01320 [Candidatus Bathyarchaeota archaeon]